MNSRHAHLQKDYSVFSGSDRVEDISLVPAKLPLNFTMTDQLRKILGINQQLGTSTLSAGLAITLNFSIDSLYTARKIAVRDVGKPLPLANHAPARQTFFNV
jgi:hypothetical protein